MVDGKNWKSEKLMYSSLRKICKRRAGAVNKEEESIFYITARKTSILAIKTSKKKAWIELCDAIDNNAWSVHYPFF